MNRSQKHVHIHTNEMEPVDLVTILGNICYRGLTFSVDEWDKEGAAKLSRLSDDEILAVVNRTHEDRYRPDRWFAPPFLSVGTWWWFLLRSESSPRSVDVIARRGLFDKLGVRCNYPGPFLDTAWRHADPVYGWDIALEFASDRNKKVLEDATALSVPRLAWISVVIRAGRVRVRLTRCL